MGLSESAVRNLSAEIMKHELKTKQKGKEPDDPNSQSKEQLPRQQQTTTVEPLGAHLHGNTLMRAADQASEVNQTVAAMLHGAGT